MTNNNIRAVKNVITDNHSVVVVSAMGKVHNNDTKVTDLLIQLHNSHYDKSIWQLISYKYMQLVKCHAVTIDINTLLDNMYNKARQLGNYAYTVSLGEELSARVMSRYLGREYLDADNVIRFGNNGKINHLATYNALSKAIKLGHRYVMAGYYGGSSQGRCVFSRGGSDISGALVARGVNAVLYENWTDVNGLCVASPHLVDDVVSVKCLSYSDMQLLASRGVTVLHRDSIYPVISRGIPINIRNIYNSNNAGTLVCSGSFAGQYLSIAEQRKDNVVVTTIVFTHAIAVALYTVIDSLEHHHIAIIELIATTNSITLTTTSSVVINIYQHLLTCNLL